LEIHVHAAEVAGLGRICFFSFKPDSVSTQRRKATAPLDFLTPLAVNGIYCGLPVTLSRDEDWQGIALHF
jgi:hypothetical protein